MQLSMIRSRGALIAATPRRQVVTTLRCSGCESSSVARAEQQQQEQQQQQQQQQQSNEKKPEKRGALKSSFLPGGHAFSDLGDGRQPKRASKAGDRMPLLDEKRDCGLDQ
jgi:hypothetical protein